MIVTVVVCFFFFYSRGQKLFMSQYNRIKHLMRKWELKKRPFFTIFLFLSFFFYFVSLYILFIAKMLLILYNHSTFPTPSVVFIGRSQKKDKKQKHCTFDLLFLLVNSIIFEMLRFACWLILSKRICILLAITSTIYSEIVSCTVNMPFKHKRYIYI